MKKHVGMTKELEPWSEPRLTVEQAQGECDLMYMLHIGHSYVEARWERSRR